MFLAYHETLVLKTEQSATVIIAHTGVTGGAAAVLSLATAEGGRLAMVAARYIEERYLNPLKEKRVKRQQEAMEKSHAAALHAGTELTDLQNTGRWQSPSMPARYSRGQKARGPAAARWPGTTGSTDETLPLCGDG